MVKNIYWFNELSRTSLPVAGGKGANLGEMFNHGFPIPEGFVISAESYFAFIKVTGIDNAIKAAVENMDTEDTAKLQEISRVLKQVIIEAKMPQDIRADIIRSYNQLCGSEMPSPQQEVWVAVRSSATAEDLPEASFAGQQATFLNIKGQDAVVLATQACWASLFETRAIYYRGEQHFDNLKVGIAVVIQRMVQSDKSGIMFSVDPVSQDNNMLVIEAGFGLGEAVVSGSITPDMYIVDKRSMKIVQKQINKQDFLITRVQNEDQNVKVEEELQEVQKINEEEIMALAKYGVMIEQHYGAPQDMEWGIEGKKVYIVQSRAITTLGKVGKNQQKSGEVNSAMNEMTGPKKQVTDDPFEVAEIPADKAVQLLTGSRASPGIAWGPVKMIYDVKEISKVYEGDILVTKMTTPDFVPAMKKAAAIVTDEGGATCHAAIVSRELGIPCIVGTREATKKLKEGQIITVDAKRGIVYDGRVAIEVKKKAADGTAIVSGPVQAFTITGTKLYVNLAEPEKADEIAENYVDGVGLLRAEFMIAGLGKHPRMMIEQGRQEEYIEALAKGLRKFCAAFHPRPVIYRATDFKTNEYRNLEGGEKFEPQEENPMIGYRGCFRYIKEPEVFALELAAIRKVREQYGMKNLHLMLPFVRRVEDLRICKRQIEQAGLERTNDFKLGIMCEIPSNVISAEDFCKVGVDFFSIGSNDLTQLTLGVDRDSPLVAEDFDERDPAVLNSIKHVIEVCHRYGVKVGICGQAPSVYPEFCEAIIRFGIDSVSCNPDVIDVTRRTIASAEQKVILEKLEALKTV
jgi:pyruvate,water dikinase